MRQTERDELLYNTDVLSNFAQSIVWKIGNECFERYFHENDIHVRCCIVTNKTESRRSFFVNKNIHVLKVIDGAGTILENECYEININSVVFQSEVDQVVVNIIDAMCFIYDLEGGINGGGTSMNKRYKNRRYRATMEDAGCICCDGNTKYGWQNYSAGDILKERIRRLKIDNDYNSVKSNICYGMAAMSVQDNDLTDRIIPQKSNSKLLECPVCHMKLRATKSGLRVACVLDGVVLEYKHS